MVDWSLETLVGGEAMVGVVAAVTGLELAFGLLEYTSLLLERKPGRFIQDLLLKDLILHAILSLTRAYSSTRF